MCLISAAIASVVKAQSSAVRQFTRDGGGIVVERVTRSRAGDFRVRFHAEHGVAIDAAAVAGAVVRAPELLEVVATPPVLHVRPAEWFLRSVIETETCTLPAYEGISWSLGFSDPNLNKPLHLGHLRNNFVGMAISRMLELAGAHVSRSAMHSDWGIHICQAAAAYLTYGNGATPASTGTKPDHFVGSQYARFHHENVAQRRQAGVDGSDMDASGPVTPLERRAVALLRDAAAGDVAAASVIEQMTAWCQAGVTETYGRIGTDLVPYRERPTTERGVRAVHAALASGHCRRRADGSVYLDLTAAGLGEPTLLRSDGTPVVFVQWFGLDIGRYGDNRFDRMVQIGGNEWKPGQAVYRALLECLGADWLPRWKSIHYGMVNLRDGKMKSRTGSVVDADSLLDELVGEVRAGTMLEGTSGDAENLALGVLKYFLLRHRRGHDVTFERKALSGEAARRFGDVLNLRATCADAGAVGPPEEPGWEGEHRQLLLHLSQFGAHLDRALAEFDPALMARFLDELVALTSTPRRLPRPLAALIRRSIDDSLRALNIAPATDEDAPPATPFAGLATVP